LQRPDVFAKACPDARDAVGALYVQCHLHRQEWGAAYHSLRRFAKIASHIGGERLVLTVWPLMVVQLKRWNERAEVQRFAQRNPSSEYDDLAKDYVRRAREAWNSGA
jgi:hypothetical protein